MINTMFLMALSINELRKYLNNDDIYINNNCCYYFSRFVS